MFIMTKGLLINFVQYVWYGKERMKGGWMEDRSQCGEEASGEEVSGEEASVEKKPVE